MINHTLSIIEGADTKQVTAIMQNIVKFQTVMQKTLKQGHDFGIIPGTPKPTLLKPGAEKILSLIGLTSEYDILEKVEDYHRGVFAYTVKCTLSKNGLKIAEGLGSCNSKEDRYRWRWALEHELPPGLDRETLQQKQWGQQIKYRVENEDIFSLVNTILKMAKKRAQVDATLTVAALSGVFTQDIEDMDMAGNPTVDHPGDVVLGFGKHKGKRLGDVPLDYVEWLAGSARDGWLKDAAARVLAGDTGGGAASPDAASRETVDQEARDQGSWGQGAVGRDFAGPHGACPDAASRERADRETEGSQPGPQGPACDENQFSQEEIPF